MLIDPVICPRCEQPGAESHEVRYEKGDKTIAFHCGTCGDDWTATAAEVFRPHLIGSTDERISNPSDPEPESITSGPIICPTCREPAALSQSVHYYKSYKIVPFHCGACRRDWNVSTLTTLPPSSDWLEGRSSPKPTQS